MHSPTPDTRPLVNRSDREHGLWLAMRSAYDKYRDASEILDAVASQGPLATSSRDRIRGIETLAAKQRIEFERYIEKRLQYSEFVNDRSNLAAMQFGIQKAAHDSTVPDKRQNGAGLWLGSMASRIAAGTALLCITVFILHEQRRMHDLDVAREQTSATLTHTQDNDQSLSLQLNPSSMPNQVGARKAIIATATSLGPQPDSVDRSAAGSRPVAQAWNRFTRDSRGSRRTEVASAVARKYEELNRSPKSGRRSYYWFKLKPSTQFKQVGTVGLSLRKDPHQRYFDLRLMVENSKVEKKHVKLREPVWINGADRLQSVAVVVTRIEKNYVQGYVSEPGHRRLEMTATDQAHQRVRGKS